MYRPRLKSESKVICERKADHTTRRQHAHMGDRRSKQKMNGCPWSGCTCFDMVTSRAANPFGCLSPPVLPGLPDRAGWGANAPRPPPRPKPGKPDWGGGSERNRGRGFLGKLFAALRRKKVRRPSPGSPSSVTSCSTTSTTPRPLARHALDDLCGQDSVVGSDGFDGLDGEGGSDCLGCCPPPLPPGLCGEPQ
jgi:hypothetical protein